MQKIVRNTTVKRSPRTLYHTGSFRRIHCIPKHYKMCRSNTKMSHHIKNWKMKNSVEMIETYISKIHAHGLRDTKSLRWWLQGWRSALSTISEENPEVWHPATHRGDPEETASGCGLTQCWPLEPSGKWPSRWNIAQWIKLPTYM